MTFTPRQLLPILHSLPSLQSGLCVALSGGLDSTVLLHALARLAVDDLRIRVRAAHIDHGLHADSGQWAEHCAREAQALGVEFVSRSVNVDTAKGTGVEAVAREARYDALRGLIREGEILLTAQHADDQLETLLLALMRGAGVRGLSGMPLVQVFGRGSLARPLLEFERADLERWAQSERLRWLDDPSNRNTDLDRNYLRHEVIAGLRERWPAAARSAARSAWHLAEGAVLLDELAALDSAALRVGRCLDVERLRALESPRRRNVLRHWLRGHGAPAPSSRKLAALEHDMLAARADSLPCVEWEGVQLRRHRGLLYCDPPRPPSPGDVSIPWDVRGTLPLPADLGRLRIAREPDSRLAESSLRDVQVRFRAGGELLQPAGDPHHRPLKKLLQRYGVLPWWRDCLPLLYTGERLLAVADLWIADEFLARGGEPAVTLLWEERPQLTAPTAPGT